jgi:hypothetical protein
MKPLLVFLALCVAAPALAQPAFPPEPPEVGAPPPPPGPPERFVLEPGHWQWSPRFQRYHWVHRHWIAVRVGYHFVPGHWAGGVWIAPGWYR